MSLRRERERVERRRLRLYEAALGLGVAILVGGLLMGFGLVLYATVLSPRRAIDAAPPAELSTRPAASPAAPPP